jgi:DNA-binding NarL/FixJ family response regulator
MKGGTRVYLLDDHVDVRAALAQRLGASADIEVVGHSAGAEEALLAVKALKPDLVLVETKRSDGRGLEIVHWLAHNVPRAVLVVLTSYASDWEEWVAARAGVAAYLLKDIATEALVQRLRELVQRAAAASEG